MAGKIKYAYQMVECDEKKIYSIIAENLYRIRCEKKISIRLLSLTADVNERHLYSIQNGMARASLPVLIRIAKALRVELSELLEGI
ncbi:MAG: helix-turn-helix domain-containing protein [Lachnospiraceae bacterium]|nr:helix-turn-helix domain-containing protein [Lachnospiraceae bacterium]MDE6252590.1 helix-turn-helix domain-containing protein [Lachnospiraceae bacterium]